jgi:hypothetical protein
MHRLPRWAAVMFALVAAAGQAAAQSSDQIRRLPVGPSETGTAPPAAPPAAPAPSPPAAPLPTAPPAAPAVVMPEHLISATPAVPTPQVVQPGGDGSATGKGCAKGARAGADGHHRWRLFHRHSGDEDRSGARHFFQRRQ